jgi:hypothetical protein
MKFKDWATRVMLTSLIFVAFIVVLLAGRATQLQKNTSNPAIASWSQYPKVVRSQFKPSSAANPPKSLFKTTAAFTKYRPRYEIAWADPSNYGQR